MAEIFVIVAVILLSYGIVLWIFDKDITFLQEKVKKLENLIEEIKNGG